MNHDEHLYDWAESYLAALINQTVDGLRISFDVGMPFAEMGIDSFRVLKIIKKLEDDFGTLPKTLLFEHVNIAELAAYFAQHHRATIEAKFGVRPPAQEQEPVPVEARPAAPAVAPSPAPAAAVEARAPAAPAAAVEVRAPAATRAPLLMLERDAYADPALASVLGSLSDRYKNEAGASRGARSIAPNIFLGSERRGFFNYARSKNIFLAYAYTGPDEYFGDLMEELLAHCTEKQLQLNVFTNRVVGSVGATRFSSTPFGALQRVVDIGHFSLDGGPMRRLRYQVTKFQKEGAARTEEYKLGADAAVESAIARVIEAWCAGKPMVNPLIHTVKEEILARTLHPQHRLFLTYLDDVLQNVILISPLGPDFKGYLMDLEFYGADMPLGGLEFAVVKIIEQLKAEGHEMLSMGGTYGCRLETCPDADPTIDRILDQLHEQKIFNDDGNLQFKNKFRTENQTIYLCRPAASGHADNILDIIMMIADPNAMQTSDAEHHTAPAVAPAAATPALPAAADAAPAHAEPVKAAPAPASSPAREREIAARTKTLAAAGYNPNNLAHEQVPFDLKTDSWAQLENAAIEAQMSHLRSKLQVAAQVDDSLRSLFPFAHFVLTSSGRMAEEIFYKAMPKKGQILSNVLFPTGLFHQIDNGFDAVELPCAQALQPDAPEVFKGDLDLDAIVKRVAADPQAIALVCIELSNNAAGGLPVSIGQLRALKPLLARHAIPLVLDATRVLENAHFLIAHEPEFAGKALWDTARELLSYADVVTCSLAKDFGINFGGLVATNDSALFERLGDLAATSGGGLDALDRKVVALALQDRKRIETMVMRRVESVRLLWSALRERGIPVARPAGGHCILFDVKRMPEFQQLEHRVASFVAWVYLNTGIRVGAHSIGMQKDTALDDMVRLAVPLGLKAAQVEQLVRRLVELFGAPRNIPELALEAGARGKLADVHARYTLRAPQQPTRAPDAQPSEAAPAPAKAAPAPAPAKAAAPAPARAKAAPAPRVEAAAAPKEAPVPAVVAPAAADGEPGARANGYAVRDIAIVGMAGRYPRARNMEELWANLVQGVDCIEAIAPERLAQRELHGPARRYRGGFIDDIDRFDSLFFNISPRDAELMDPQERLFLEVAWEAMEDAGYSPDTLVPEGAPRNVGVFVGAVWAMYQMVGLEQRQAGNDTSPNSFLWSIANHASYCLDLCGPSMAVDTACSSSLTALYLACEAIYRGECSAAIVGGVNLDLHQGKRDINEFGGALSPDDTCRTFGKGANGYVAGEGVGAILIKPLADAERDGDAIYGVVKGVAVNHGGRAGGYAVPNPKSQADVIVAALERAGVDARTMSYIEAHGTGTQLGDPIEIKGLSNAFEKYGVPVQSCAIGSVKTNIGHLEAAAGVVGVSKVLLQMRHGQLAPSLHSRELNEFIEFDTSPFYVVQERAPWAAKLVDGVAAPLRAGVSSFGAGGSNAHVILESYPAAPVANDGKPVERVFALSARTEDQLRDVALRLRDHLARALDAGERIDLASVAYTLQVGRKVFDHRAAILATTPQELVQRLSGFIAQAQDENVFAGSAGNAAALNKLLTRKEMDRIGQLLVSGRDLRRLAGLWADGVIQEWQGTAACVPARRTHLPTYPFADRRHWVGHAGQAVARRAQATAALHPMLDSNESTFERQVFRKRFDERDFFIYDHLVTQIPTLPGVAYLELARRAGELAAGRPVRRIKNILWLSPIAVHQSVPQDVQIELKPNGEVVHFEVYSQTETGQRAVHAQGQLLYSGGDPAQPETVDLDAIRARCPKQLDGRKAYPQFNALGLGLGPSFQVLGDICTNDEETLGRLSLSPARSGELGELQLHPALLDGSLQAGAAVQIANQTSEMAVPYSIGEVELVRPLQAQCWSYVRVVKDGKHAGSRVRRADVLIVNDQGEVLVRLRETVGVPLTQVHKDASAPEDAAPPLYYGYDWINAPLAAGAAGEASGAVLVFDNDERLAQAYRARLAQAGGEAGRVVLVQPGAQFEQAAADRFTLDPAQPAHFSQLLDALERAGLRATQTCFAWQTRHGADEALDAALERGVFALLFFCQALAARKPQDKARVLYLHHATDDGPAPHHEAINGFAASLHHEHPKLFCKTVELRGTQDDPGLEADILAAEFAPAADEARTVRYDSGERSVRRLTALELAEHDPLAAPLREGGVYLITGGAGGLGLLFAEYLGREYKAKLVLTGRSELGEKQQARLDAIRELGAEVVYVRADMADQGQLAQALAEGRRHFGPLQGVIHSAGVLRDSYVRNKTLAEMQDVFAPKVHATVHLDALTREDPLDFFALFSSMTAVGGNPGQCDYGYANHFMDSFALRREAQHKRGERQGKTLSLNWSLWQDGGMKLDEQAERLFRKATGIRPLRTEAGLRAFADGLASAHTQMVVVEGDRDMLELAWGLRKAPAPAAAPAQAAVAASAAVPAGGAEQLVALLRREMSQIAMDFLKLDASDLRTDEILLNLGFDSIGLATFANKVNEKFSLDITPILFFDYPSIDEIAKHLASERRDDLLKFVGSASAPASAPAPASQPVESAPTPASGPIFVGKGWNPAALDQPHSAPSAPGAAYGGPEFRFRDQPIAIVGMSGVMPQSDDLNAFWNNLRAGKNMVSLIPADRWSWEEHFGDPQKEPGKTNSKWGGFMSEVDKFDPLFFGISPREAQMMDPQQRLFLQTVWAAIEDSGHKVSDLAGTKTGLFVGAATNDYVNLVNRLNIPINAYTASGNSHSVLANRVSFLLNLRGPSAPIDTACSSSLIALHRAIESIHTGSSEMAIVGGVQVMLTPAAHVSFSMAGMLSDDGKCKTFDKRANGYVRGEGVGAILIKPLAKAEADGDHIYAVVKATAENHGGKVTTLTAPNASAQAELLVEAYTKGGVDPTTVGYIECHGTGTSLGDPIEVQALNRAFAELYQKHGLPPAAQPHCGLSSVKTNIGHLETAAGIAGILKALLAIRNREIPPNVHFEELNPYINLNGTPFYIPREAVAWEAPRDANGKAQPRRAGISSFGFGGANAHVVLEEYAAPERADGNAARPRVFVLSAKNAERLQAYAARLLDHLDSHQVDLDRIAYTLQVGRDVFAERMACVAATREELRAKLAAFVAEGASAAGVHCDHVRPGKSVQHEAAESVGAQALRELIERGELEQLAAHWVKGAEPDWKLLYAHGLPRRAPLPTYPFARETCWFPMGEAAANTPALPAASAEVLHPLVQRNTSTFQEQKFASRFSGREFFLTDHVVESQRVLPGVAYMEMARAAGSLAAQRDVRVIRNLVWLTPLIVGEQGAEVDIVLTPKKDEIEFTVSGANRTVTHCRGQIGFGSGAQTALQADVAGLRARCVEEVLNGPDLYAYFKNAGLTLGAGFQIVQRIWANDTEALAQVQMPAHLADEVDQYVLHPALMDGALHTAIGLMKKGDLDPPLCLPFAVAEVEVFGSVRDIRYGYATWSSTDRQTDPSHWKVNFLFLDGEGKVLVRIKEFASRPLQAGQAVGAAKPAAIAAPVDETQSVLHAMLPVWQPMTSAKRAALPAADANIVLAGRDPAQLAWLRTAYPQARPLDIDAAMLTPDLAAQLRDAAFDDLVWMAPDVAADDAPGQSADLIGDQEQGVLAMFRLTKALLAAGYGARNLRWTIVVARTQQVRAGEQVRSAHAGVFGYVGSLAREYPHWQLRLVDVESLRDMSAGACLGAPQAPQGKGLAYRQGEWFQQELAVGGTLPVTAPAYRQGGVYVVIGGAGGIGEVLSRHLIERYQAKLVWIGRRSCDAAIQRKIDALGEIGTKPLYISADASDLAALERARAQILREYPAIHGVVHSALVLHDQSVALLDEAAFKASLCAKVDTSVNVDRVFGGLDLDFVLFFSSILSFHTSPGQSNYAAGCAFQDAFAHHLRSVRPYPVKTVNWGYWGNVGVVADASYARSMEQMGIGSIEPDEGMAQLEFLVSAPLAQLAVLKTVGARALAGIERLERIDYYPQQAPTVLPAIHAAFGPSADEARLGELEAELPSAEQEELVAEILAATLMHAGLLPGNAAQADPAATLARHQARWLEASVRYLQTAGWLDPAGALARTPQALEQLWARWGTLKAQWNEARPHNSGQTTLIENCLRSLPDILGGRQMATAVLFPRSSMELVESVYRGNPVADHFNRVLGKTLEACIDMWLQREPGRQIRILEIGAGTGGTTATLLPVLERFGAAVAEYCYTDVSKAFLMHGTKHHQPRCPALTTALFDVCKPLANQGVEPGRYDIVVAANVLHATPNIRTTLRNAKAALRTNGVLLLNEISTWSMFSHLTFGLLEGWWAYEDEAVRLADCPGIGADSWSALLKEEGFPAVFFPAQDTHQLGQQIVAAASDGVVRQAPAPAAPAAAVASKAAAAPSPAVASVAVVAPPAAPVTVAAPPAAVATAAVPAPAAARPAPITQQRKVNQHMGREHIRSLVAAKLSDALQLEAARIRPDEPFAEYGVDSIVGVNLVRTISEALQIELDATSLFEYSTVNDLADYIHSRWGAELDARMSPPPATHHVADAGAHQAAVEAPAVPLAHRFATGFEPAAVAQEAPQEEPRVVLDEPIAVVGASGRFAGSETLDEFWRHLRDGDELITEVARWRPEESTIGPVQRAGYCRHGSFIDSMDLFDPAFFRISTEEADHMDPQQRLFLEECWKALEDAGYASKGMHERRCGVFVGCGSSKYDTLMGSATPAQAFWGNSEAVVPSRIAYYLDLQGPAIAVNTACSSSLVTIHLACQSLRSRETEMALAGGVFLQPTPGFHQVANRSGMLSPTGQCFPFDARANGFVPGEGVGVVVLKRLRDALRDGDHIHGVIRASGVNQDGSSNGIIAPNAAAQERLESEVYERFGIDPSSIQVLEAHGTGTLMGDSIEFGAITRAFRKHTEQKQFCAIGSVKANIGHAATAAGVASVLKMLLALRHREIPPIPNFERANPALDMAASPFYVNGEVRPWESAQGAPRRAAVSSFGFGGTNAHLVLEEAPPVARRAANLPGYLIVLSGRTGEQLRQQARNLHDYLRTNPDVPMQDLSFTLIVGRTHLPVRLACVAQDAEQLMQRLQDWLSAGAAPGVFASSNEEGAMRERPSLRNYGNFCIEQLAHADAATALEHLATVADLYALGYTLDYARIIPPGVAGRIPLPTYPFARERHWIAPSQQAGAGLQRPASVLHPLLHTNTSDFNQVSFATTLTGTEFYLAEQQADGEPAHPVLPACVQLEMAREAVARATRAGGTGAVVELLKVEWGEPVVVAGPTTVNVALRQAIDGTISFQISSGDAPTIVHCRGSASCDAATAEPAKLDIARLRNEMHGGLADGDSVYRAQAAMGLHIREEQRAVVSALRGEGELLVHLRIPPALAGHAAEASAAVFGLHPVLAEAALNVSTILAAPPTGQPGLLTATGLENLSFLAPGADEMFAWARRASGDGANGAATTLDIDFIDSDGRVCAKVHGLSFGPAKPAARRPGANGKDHIHVPATANGKDHSHAPAALSGEERIEQFLRQAAADELHVAPAAVDLDATYFDLGFTSLGVANLIRKTNTHLSAELPPSIVFEYPTIRSFAAHLARSHAGTGMPGKGDPSSAIVVDPNKASANGTRMSTVLEQIALPTQGINLKGYEKLTF